MGNNYATDGHLASDKHLQRVEWREWCIVNGSATCDETPARWGDPAHFELRVWSGNSPGDGTPWWWCRLCDQWADDCHIRSRKHTKRAQWDTDWYLGDGGVQALTDRRSPADEDLWRHGIREQVQTPSHSPWQQAWSEEHQQFYYWHEETRAAQWDPPDFDPPAVVASKYVGSRQLASPLTQERVSQAAHPHLALRGLASPLTHERVSQAAYPHLALRGLASPLTHERVSQVARNMPAVDSLGRDVRWC